MTSAPASLSLHAPYLERQLTREGKLKLPEEWKSLAGNLLVVFLKAVGVVLVVLGISSFRKASVATNWPSVTASIRHREIRSRKVPGYYGQLIRYFPEVTYSYQVAGESFEGHAIAIDAKTAEDYDETKAKGFLDGLGDKAPAYYDPNDPSRAVLMPNPSKARRSHFLALITSGVLLILAGSGFFFLKIMQ